MKIRSATMTAIVSVLLLIAGSSFQAVHAYSQENVFSWKEIPQNQEVPITRAEFDRGGYQLYDTSGEIIVIPFAGHSLCSLKFHRSYTGGIYLVNRGYAPVLYVPGNGCLENATVPDAYWYPFAYNYDPSEPVYMSCAPSYSYYDNMGWYRGMHCYGGYRSSRYIDEDASFGFVIGLIFPDWRPSLRRLASLLLLLPASP